MIERSDYVRVTSTKETIRGRYDGVDYEFRPKEPQDIPKYIARHIFGFSEPDKTTAFTRLGWMRNSEELTKAKERLQLVRFSEAPALIEAPVEELSDLSASERVPNSGERPLSSGGKSGAPVAAGASEDHLI